MQLLVDALNSTSGWTASDDTKFKVHRTNDIKDYIANKQPYSLLLHAIGSSNGQYVEKTFTAIDVSEYDELVLWVYSSRLKNNGAYMNNLSEFKYKIDFNGTMSDFCMPLYDSFTYLTFDIRDIDSIDRIRITSLHNAEDYLVLSSLMAAKDEIPIDIFKSCKSELESYLTRNIGNGILLGTVSTTSGNETLNITGGINYLARYSTIKITDGINSEIHQIGRNDEEVFYLTDMYDGATIINNFTNANIYLYIPVEYGLLREILIPGILIKGWDQEPILRGSKTGKVYNSYREDQTVKEKYVPQILNWYVEFHVESRNGEILQYMADAIRNLIESETIWVNGKRYETYFDGTPTYIEPVTPEDVIHKLVYRLKIEIKECWDNPVTLYNTTTITDSININA